ncbi:MAG: bifunctional uroporphyrinogen-III C-methyltransferase/uroporphyrinogen-III synthase, partial [Calditrichaeota bacterium]|nr:bifunctional uroporphyrinogen-III C-methyltransferase/uroporphyrinogen-III synthase [Calditrichota bacterium]
PDAIVFTSASTVRYFCEMVDRTWFTGRSCVVCIGPVTAAEAQKQGLQVDLMPAEPNAESLVASLASFYQTQSAANVGQAVSTF